MLRYLPLAVGSLLIATAAIAQPAPPPPRDAPGPHGDRPMPPPPPRGAAIHIERGPDGVMRLDVHCVERDTTKECADVANQLLDKLGMVPAAK